MRILKPITGTLLILSILFLQAGFSQEAYDLFNYIDPPQLNESQQHYFDADQKTNEYYDYSMATINTDLFDQDKIQLRLNNYYFDFHKENRKSPLEFGRTSWVGRIPGTHDFAHFVINDDMVVGHINIEGSIFMVKPLTGGLHIIGEVNVENIVDCNTSDLHDRDNGEGEKAKFNPKASTNMDEHTVMSESHDSRSTGECNIRVLVVYTPAIKAAFADILGEAINRISIANTGSANSGLSFEWELAAVKEIVYDEDTFNAFEHRNKLIDPGDGVMDEVHTWRNLWSADQVSLLFVGGGGATRISLDQDKALSSTGSGNFTVFTFHHELAHNFLCTHDLINTTEPGSAPYAGWGETVNGCFRTIMAYPQACGGVGSCSRQNVYSDNSQLWSCNSVIYGRGTIDNRNTDILNINKSVIVDHRQVGDNITYGGDYDWLNKEAVHFAANNEVGYNSASNSFVLHNGSQGSFRASDGVTLGNGFWARSGSDFRAYRESCTPIATPQADEVIAQSKNDEMRNIDEKFEIQIFPNPFSANVNIEYYLQEDSYVSISLFDISGKELDNPLIEKFQSLGVHTFQYDGSGLSPGNYLCKIRIDDKVIQKRLSVVR